MSIACRRFGRCSRSSLTRSLWAREASSADSNRFFCFAAVAHTYCIR